MYKTEHFAVKESDFKIEPRVSPGSANAPLAASQGAAASGNQVEDKNEQRNHQQNVNQPTAYVQAESQ
jgi:hypothetical protein